MFSDIKLLRDLLVILKRVRDISLFRIYFKARSDSATQTPHTFCYIPPSVCDRKYCNRCRNERVTIIFLRYIISLFHYILKQLCTLVSVTSSGYLPRREAETVNTHY